MFKYILAIVLLASLSLVLVQRSKLTHPISTSSPSSKMVIITSFYPLYYFTQRIVGDLAEVSLLTPPALEPHDYELTQNDRVHIQQSDLVIVNGVFEKWLPAIQKEEMNPNRVNSGPRIIVTGQDLFSLKNAEGGNQTYDPHIWLSPQLAQIQVERILSAVTSVDPTHADTYAKRGTLLKEQLNQLNEKYKLSLSVCNKNTIVTTHTAFTYLTHELGINQIAISGVSPEEEPSLQKLAEITQQVKDQNIHYVFFEKLKNERYAKTIQTETGATPLVLDPLEGITDNDVRSGKTYLSIMNDNLYSLQKALECK